MTINEKIKNLRVSLDLSQEKFAKEVGTSIQTIARIESRNDYAVSTTVLNKIINKFNLDKNEYRNKDVELLEKVLERRCRYDMNDSNFAKLIGISPAEYNKYKSGYRKMTQIVYDNIMGKLDKNKDMEMNISHQSSPDDFLEKIMTLRNRHSNMTDAEFCRKCGIGVSLFCKWKNGKSKPSRKSFETIKAVVMAELKDRVDPKMKMGDVSSDILFKLNAFNNVMIKIRPTKITFLHGNVFSIESRLQSFIAADQSTNLVLNLDVTKYGDDESIQSCKALIYTDKDYVIENLLVIESFIQKHNKSAYILFKHDEDEPITSIIERCDYVYYIDKNNHIHVEKDRSAMIPKTEDISSSEEIVKSNKEALYNFDIRNFEEDFEIKEFEFAPNSDYIYTTHDTNDFVKVYETIVDRVITKTSAPGEEIKGTPLVIITDTKNSEGVASSPIMRVYPDQVRIFDADYFDDIASNIMKLVNELNPEYILVIRDDLLNDLSSKLNITAPIIYVKNNDNDTKQIIVDKISDIEEAEEMIFVEEDLYENFEIAGFNHCYSYAYSVRDRDDFKAVYKNVYTYLRDSMDDKELLFGADTHGIIVITNNAYEKEIFNIYSDIEDKRKNIITEIYNIDRNKSITKHFEEFVENRIREMDNNNIQIEYLVVAIDKTFADVTLNRGYFSIPMIHIRNTDNMNTGNFIYKGTYIGGKPNDTSDENKSENLYDVEEQEMNDIMKENVRRNLDVNEVYDIDNTSAHPRLVIPRKIGNAEVSTSFNGNTEWDANTIPEVSKPEADKMLNTPSDFMSFMTSLTNNRESITTSFDISADVKTKYIKPIMSMKDRLDEIKFPHLLFIDKKIKFTTLKNAAFVREIIKSLPNDNVKIKETKKYIHLTWKKPKHAIKYINNMLDIYQMIMEPNDKLERVEGKLHMYRKDPNTMLDLDSISKGKLYIIKISSRLSDRWTAEIISKQNPKDRDRNFVLIRKRTLYLYIHEDNRSPAVCIQFTNTKGRIKHILAPMISPKSNSSFDLDEFEF